MNSSLRNGACVLALLSLLTACGGGSDDDGTLPQPVVSEEALRLRRMDAPAAPDSGTAAPAADAAASAATA